ncbi:MAG: type II toxin-antitoxin system PemK/MazF family toxin [Aeromicrobium sp.]|uniref:type II toxin-antitoxin system PemK/MazF family toxin n=1 Tax=Aeromicrobium sp. TaxID=1871063 RepID=UPI0039E2F559
MSPWPLVRGQVVRADIGLNEPKLFVIVSNNRRNQRLRDVLAVRLTTSRKPSIPSIVELDETGVAGRAVCDDIVGLYEDEIIGLVAALSPGAMRRVDQGLAAALGLGD